MRMYVVACPSPSLISSAAIVQGSPFISHLLASPLRRRRIFWAKSGCAPNGRRPGTDAAVPPKCTSKRKRARKRNTMGATPIGHRDKSNSIRGGGAHFPLTDEQWQGVARLFFTLLGRPGLFFRGGNQGPASTEELHMVSTLATSAGWILSGPFHNRINP